MRNSLKTFLYLAGAVLVVVITHYYALLFMPMHPRSASSITITVPKGASFRLIADRLEREGIIKSSDGVTIAGALTGSFTRIKAGEYELSPAMTAMEIIGILSRGRTKEHTITFPEGYNIQDMAGLLSDEGLIQRDDEFLEKALDMKYTASLGLAGPTLEGYLFPDTYRLTKDMGVDEIIRKMTFRFKDIYASGFKDRAEKRGFSMKALVTLASIIEKEAGSKDEMRAVSAVFNNRLKRGIALQSDPTVIYAIEGFDGNLKKEHLSMKDPYNTYRYSGLPPGPIANPGKDALEAALDPLDEGYLYFVSRNNGTHQFSKTLAEHNRAVNLYQRGLAAR
ncbi:MAG: endolytic transglycosylase MltG [Deltaproteobacteria bacterium]|nr:endolytic transglycosylase MltG [Deltaproteobacteria bacterium]